MSTLPGDDPNIVVALSIEAPGWPEEPALRDLATRALAAASRLIRFAPVPDSEISLVFADDAAIQVLNASWRGKDWPTNVLSFPQQPDGPMLGDIVFARETVSREAALVGIAIEHHIAHLIIHGFFHLLGYDHEEEDEAERMEELERRALASIGVADPYQAVPLDQ